MLVSLVMEGETDTVSIGGELRIENRGPRFFEKRLCCPGLKVYLYQSAVWPLPLYSDRSLTVG